MKNNEKIDIKLEADSGHDGELTEEQRCQGYYNTALRYMNIAAYMNHYEDQDKYYNKAVDNLKKAKAGIPGLEPMIDDVVKKQFYARAKGKIIMYNEACSIRDKAKTPTDYLSAQTLFERIHKYEVKHVINPDHVSPELFEEAGRCSDSEQQAIRCGQLATQLSTKQHRKSLISSSLILLAVIAILAFSRTLYSRLLVADLCKLTRHYDRAYEYYDYVYKKTGDEKVFEKYEESRYLSAKTKSQTTNTETVRDSFRELARLNYKDSAEYLVKMEKARIAELEDGEKIRFGEVNWRILTHDGDKVLLIKDKTQGDIPFHTGGGDTDWEHSSVRYELNNNYINELFSFQLEREAIIDTVLPVSDNPVFGTKGGSQTTDKLFLLSCDEFANYAAYMPETHNLWWLRTPGSTASSMAFVSTTKDIMYNGYDVGSDVIKVRPAIWVDVSE